MGRDIELRWPEPHEISYYISDGHLYGYILELDGSETIVSFIHKDCVNQPDRRGIEVRR